jgi:DNA-binding NtrC family response regulator|tara:strand:- start:1794 stop:2189 length:396 start_codon:yes stop_codon:yes gene_type:complete
MKENKTIFVVEDSQILSEIIALQFKRNFNCNVIIFKNADNIFFNINKYLPDLIVIDYSFNDSKLNFHNGLDVIVELRKDSNIPVIVLSGQRNMSKAIEIVQKGANDYISKDDDDFMNSLLESIKEVLNIRK